jgi:hypothetical protein
MFRSFAQFVFFFSLALSGPALADSSPAELKVSDLVRACFEAIEREEDAEVYAVELAQRSGFNLGSENQEKGKLCLETMFGAEFDFDGGRFFSQEIETALADEKNRLIQEVRQRAGDATRQRIVAHREAVAAEEEAVRQRVCELREIVTETNKTLRLAQAVEQEAEQERRKAEEERRIETLRATIQECTTWFDEDARAALTNDVCNSIFASGGLPNSDVSGPSTSEIPTAELVNTSEIRLAQLANTNATAELEILIESGMLLETIEAMAAEMGISEDGDPYDCDE